MRLQGEELECAAIHLTSFLKKMLGGALIPGKPVANMYFTMYGYNSVVQALNLLRDLKQSETRGFCSDFVSIIL